MHWYRYILYSILRLTICVNLLFYYLSFLALMVINRIVWGTKLLLYIAAVLAHPVDCMSSCHVLKAQGCMLFESEWLL